MLGGYFDDSGSHGSPVAVMAGYVAPAGEWTRFELKTKTLFKREDIPFFRAKLFEHGEDQFRGWTDARRLRFSMEWCDIAQEHALRGVSAAVVKTDFAAGKLMDRRFPPISAHSYCMQIAVRHLLEDAEISKAVGKNGLSLVIESSTSADAGILQDLNRMFSVNGIADALRSVAFKRKEHARALQFADFLAYYSHRYALTCRTEGVESIPELLVILRESVPTIMKFAHAFTPNPEYFAALKVLRRKRAS